MKKASFSFRAICSGNYLHHFFLGKKNNTVRHKNRSRSVMAAAILAASLSVSSLADAQCNTFQNADEANPLLSVFPAGKKIAGFAFADIDGDGDQDVYVDFLGKPEKYFDPLHLYKNIGTKTHPVFKEDMNTGFGKNLAGGQNGQIQFVDIDGDGDLDYFASDSTYSYYGGAKIFYYKNVGTAKEPHFEPSTFAALPVFGTKYIQPFQFVDIDGDGDYDLYEASSYPYLFLSSYQQRVYYNIGTPQNAVFDKFVYVEEDYTLYRTYYDWNRDGQLDYFASNDYYNGRGNTQYYRHTGSVNSLTYELDRKMGPVFGNGPLYRIIDLNNDGAPEVFDFNAHYSTLAPVAVIQDTVVDKSGRRLTVLSSKNRYDNYTYRWEYNGKTIPGAEKYFIATTQPGTYTLYITDVCGTGVSLNYELLKTTPPFSVADSKLTGVANNISRIDVKAYPNPFVSAFTLQLSGKFCTVKITDMAGKVLLAQTTSGSTLQVGGNLTAGSYIVQVWQGKEMIYNATMIKQ